MKSEKIKKLYSMLNDFGRTVVLTGAGVSTESGIPDYRSPGKGLWEKMDQSVVELRSFIEKPERYYTYAMELYPLRSQAKPNIAHYYMARKEKEGKLHDVVTQNVDGLHKLAGSKSLYELHGNIREAVCLNCGGLESMDKVMTRVRDGENPPLCKHCKDILKPNAVFFGEGLPLEVWKESLERVKSANLLLVVGTSLLVSPVNTFPRIAIESGAGLVIINLQETPFDTEADLVIHEKIGNVFRELEKLDDQNR